MRKGGQVVVAGDGQVSMGQTVVKSNARKVRRLGGGSVIAGFAGATADAITLFERLEAKLEQYSGQLTRACVELAKDWRTDRYLRRLEAMMAVADKDVSLILSGTGDVLEPEDDIIGIGSGGGYALAAARALIDDRRARRRDRRAPRDGDRRRDLRLHQRQDHARKAAGLTMRDVLFQSAPSLPAKAGSRSAARASLRPTPGFAACAGMTEECAMTSFSPREIVSELDRFIVGQDEAKRAVAIALRNRWRRQQLPPELREEVLPKNILMIGPTGCGKTEIARRLARLAEAPFLKVEATKFTEVGYVGRDVEQIARDLVEIAIGDDPRAAAQAGRGQGRAAPPRSACSTRWSATNASADTRQKFRKMLREGALDDREIEVTVQESAAANLPTFEIPGMPGAQMGMLNLGDIFGKAFGGRADDEEDDRRRQPPRADGRGERQAARSGEGRARGDPVGRAERHRLSRRDRQDLRPQRARRRLSGADVSREGVQRDLLPLIEGTTVATKHGTVKTDHILFIASGAFHLAKPSDLLPELQGRLPIRVELKALDRADFRRILTEPEASLIKQYRALLATEGVTLDFGDDAIDEIALLAEQINATVENIGARRLHTILERLLEEISFNASDQPDGTVVAIDAAYVRERVGALAQNADLSRFIL